MNAEDIRNLALSYDDVTEGFPFGESTLVFKTHGKIFLLLALDELPLTINVKCDPEEAQELREQYASILPGYHMNKKHWNTILLTDEISSDFVKECIGNSYHLVKKKRRD